MHPNQSALWIGEEHMHVFHTADPLSGRSIFGFGQLFAEATAGLRVELKVGGIA